MTLVSQHGKLLFQLGRAAQVDLGGQQSCQLRNCGRATQGGQNSQNRSLLGYGLSALIALIGYQFKRFWAQRDDGTLVGAHWFNENALRFNSDDNTVSLGSDIEPLDFLDANYGTELEALMLVVGHDPQFVRVEFESTFAGIAFDRFDVFGANRDVGAVDELHKAMSGTFEVLVLQNSHLGTNLQ